MKDLVKPASYNKAMKSLQQDHWIMAMQTEIDQLINMNTWKLVKLLK